LVGASARPVNWSGLRHKGAKDYEKGEKNSAKKGSSNPGRRA